MLRQLIKKSLRDERERHKIKHADICHNDGVELHKHSQTC